MAARILSERQFHPQPGPLKRFFDWLWRHLHLPNLHLSGLSGAGWQTYLALALLAGAAAGVVVLAARGGFFQRLRSAGSSPAVVVAEGDETLTPANWHREAGRLAAEGRYREALRCRYRALVGELAQRGLVDEVPGRTSGDYERLVSSLLPGIAARFSVLTRQFERCWYGRERAGSSAQAAFGETARAIVAELDALRLDSPGQAPRPGPGGAWPRGELVGTK
jgi:hypothetical protein